MSLVRKLARFNSALRCLSALIEITTLPSLTLPQGRLLTAPALGKCALGFLSPAHCAVSSSLGCAVLSAPWLVFSAAPQDICALLLVAATLRKDLERRRGLEIRWQEISQECLTWKRTCPSTHNSTWNISSKMTAIAKQHVKLQCKKSCTECSVSNTEI